MPPYIVSDVFYINSKATMALKFCTVHVVQLESYIIIICASLGYFSFKFWHQKQIKYLILIKLQQQKKYIKIHFKCVVFWSTLKGYKLWNEAITNSVNQKSTVKIQNKSKANTGLYQNEGYDQVAWRSRYSLLIGHICRMLFVVTGKIRRQCGH